MLADGFGDWKEGSSCLDSRTGCDCEGVSIPSNHLAKTEAHAGDGFRAPMAETARFLSDNDELTPEMDTNQLIIALIGACSTLLAALLNFRSRQRAMGTSSAIITTADTRTLRGRRCRSTKTPGSRRND